MGSFLAVRGLYAILYPYSLILKMVRNNEETSTLKSSVCVQIKSVRIIVYRCELLCIFVRANR